MIVARNTPGQQKFLALNIQSAGNHYLAYIGSSFYNIRQYESVQFPLTIYARPGEYLFFFMWCINNRTEVLESGQQPSFSFTAEDYYQPPVLLPPLSEFIPTYYKIFDASVPLNDSVNLKISSSSSSSSQLAISSHEQSSLDILSIVVQYLISIVVICSVVLCLGYFVLTHMIKRRRPEGRGRLLSWECRKAVLKCKCWKKKDVNLKDLDQGQSER